MLWERSGGLYEDEMCEGDVYTGWLCEEALFLCELRDGIANEGEGLKEEESSEADEGREKSD